MFKGIWWNKLWPPLWSTQTNAHCLIILCAFDEWFMIDNLVWLVLQPQTWILINCKNPFFIQSLVVHLIMVELSKHEVVGPCILTITTENTVISIMFSPLYRWYHRSVITNLSNATLHITEAAHVGVQKGLMKNKHN
jgi:hypothetical protein